MNSYSFNGVIILIVFKKMCGQIGDHTKSPRTIGELGARVLSY